MAKKINIDSIIHLELEKIEAKVNEFQTYLETNPISSKVMKDGKLLLADDEQDKLHKEIIIQIKMQDALFTWLPLLEKLREKEESKKINIRGGTEETGGMFKGKF